MARAVTEKEKQDAQRYAQEALEGKRGYLSATQVPNAVMNAQVPIKATKTTASTAGSGGDATVQRYLNELSRQRAERQAMLDAQYKQGKKES